MTPRTPHDTAASRTPHGFRWMRWIPIALAAVLGAVGVLYLLWPDWHWVHHEGGPLEISQLSIVLATVAAAAAIIARQRGKDRINGVWLLTLFLLLTARELDLQEQLNEEVLGEWAVSYRSRWWMSWDVPLGIKLMWGGVGAVLGTALVIPPLLVRAPVLKLIRVGDAATWLFFGGCFLYGMGYVMDDILGRGVLVDGDQGQVIEETFELLGGLSFLASTVVTLRTPLMRRAAALPRRTGA